MLVRDNETVRRQYFEAIETTLPVVPVTVQATCADFMRRVAFRALRLSPIDDASGVVACGLAWVSRRKRLGFTRCLAYFIAESAEQALRDLYCIRPACTDAVLYFR